MAVARIALLCGGPSPERGISLNSARSVLDHLGGEQIEIVPIFFDWDARAWQLPASALYSNTPTDFDHKVADLGLSLDDDALRDVLAACTIAFPVIHGAFGENGTLQAMLEDWQIPFVGSPSVACAKAFDKARARETLAVAGERVLPWVELDPCQTEVELRTAIEDFHRDHGGDGLVVKPTQGGSSVGVSLAASVDQTLAAVCELRKLPGVTKALLEPRLQGSEFTLTIVETADGPLPLLPSEIAFAADETFFSYRRKYLPTREIEIHCPPRFPDLVVTRIRETARRLFTLFGLRDTVRLDGWCLSDQSVCFTDINLASGLEQNSFLFQQAAQVGWTHRAVLRHVVDHALARQDRPCLPTESAATHGGCDLAVVLGGDSSERQVSLMSGINVWLKLTRSSRWNPQPFLLDQQGCFWPVPYAWTLRHTVEEVLALCQMEEAERTRIHHWSETIRAEAAGIDWDLVVPHWPAPMPEAEFLGRHKHVFLALHGGIGEDGTLQARCEQAGVVWTGSDAGAARLCMDKAATAEVLRTANLPGVTVLDKWIIDPPYDSTHAKSIWSRAVEVLGTSHLLVKPIGEGCSAGVAALDEPEHLGTYLDLIARQAPIAPAGIFPRQTTQLEMPVRRPAKLLLEPFFRTDRARFDDQGGLALEEHSGWMEVTIGLLEIDGRLHALPPSLTVAEGAVLDLAEKFQGGTGVNLTPPPDEWIGPKAREAARRKAEEVARVLGMAGFGRLDAFLERTTGNLCVIEMNAIPGLTPSTVIYQQALADETPLPPRAFLEVILEAARRRAAPLAKP